jgi:SAM-dependent methyltransferase
MESMKAMKLYDQVERIHNELALIEGGLDGPLAVEQLTPFDQYHYLGTEAVDAAIQALGLTPEMRVLDIGSGIGGPARYIAARTGAHVTALELQHDLDAVAADLTARCGLNHLVEHRCGNVLDGVGERYDAIVSFLCFLHIADRPRLLAACRDALIPNGAMYVEDFARPLPRRDSGGGCTRGVRSPPFYEGVEGLVGEPGTHLSPGARGRLCLGAHRDEDGASGRASHSRKPTSSGRHRGALQRRVNQGPWPGGNDARGRASSV